jgi:hypothetical protein
MCAPFSAPAAPKNGLGMCGNPRPGCKIRTAIAWLALAMFNFSMAFEPFDPGWRSRSTSVPG